MSLEQEHRKLVHNHIVATHLACTFVLLAVVWKYLDLKPTDAHPAFLIYFFLLSLPFALEIYLLGSRDEVRTDRKRVVFLYIFVPALTAIIILFFTESRVPFARTVLLLPVLVAGYLKGRTAAYITGLVCIGTLLVHDAVHGTPVVVAMVDTNFVLISIILLVAWFTGTISDLESYYHRRLTSLVYIDDLTGLRNQRFLYEHLTSISAEASEANPLSLIFVDVDNFKQYNDVFGHQMADRVLADLGQILTNTVSEPGFAARYGGEEFVVVLPGCDTEAAVAVAEQVRRQVEEMDVSEGNQVTAKVTVSCGVATMPRHAQAYKELIRNADQALYEAKFLAKNRVVTYCSVFDDVGGDEKDLVNSIQTLISVINVKDRYTYGHSVRVLKYASELAAWLNLPAEETRFLRYAAFLHDIGKIEIDRYLLNTPGSLTEEEINTLRQHPHWGSEIVGSIPALQKTATIIRHHHENFDGSGYPDRLKGDEIPLAARIIRIVDSYDAMTTDRPYRSALPASEALERLAQDAGTMFDPMLVKLFCSKMLVSRRSI